jgi:hypothetical protein
MFNSSILDVAIGLVFCFASVALFVSAINEFIASQLKLRHNTLLDGIKRLLNDQDGTIFVKDLYDHALINPMSLPQKNNGEIASSKPAYIASKDFANAFIDVIQGTHGDFEKTRAAVEKIADERIKTMLTNFLARSKGSTEEFATHIAAWFDNGMDRLSGAYKRQAQLRTFVIGFLVALFFKIDSIHVLTELWSRPTLAAAISGPAALEMIKAAGAAASQGEAGQFLQKNSELAAPSHSKAEPSPGGGTGVSGLAGDVSCGPLRSGGNQVNQWICTLRTLPVGWGNATEPSLFGWIELIIGLIITASSAVFGAPFWFDMLQRLVQIRGVGPKPPTENDKSKSGVKSTATP